VLRRVAYIALRMTFGGSPNPPTWCSFSEMVTDLSNEIMLCDEWDPSALHSPAQVGSPTPAVLPENITIAPASPLALDIPVRSTARTDSFIDDLILVFLDTPRNRARCPQAVPLAIHVTSRPHAGESEPIKRRPLLSPEKLMAEGLPVERQSVLGWTIDTRRLLVVLPQDKFLAWSGDLRETISSRRISNEGLLSLIGRLNHVSFLIPLSRHFLTRLRRRLSTQRHGRQQISLSDEEINDLALWLDFLASASHGISMNRITHRRPSQLGWSDSCTFGLGGFTFSGTAWRIRIPQSSPIYGVSRANNVFEFLALAITLWLVIIDCSKSDLEDQCILALGDSTSALGWLYRVGHVPPSSFYHGAVNIIARRVARLVMDSSHCIASQHIKGAMNVVSDLLSFSGTARSSPHPLAFDDPDDADLTARFHSSLPQLIPRDFSICPLPAEVSSFAVLVLQTTELSFIRNKKERTRTGTGPGVVGNISASTWVSPITPSSIVYPTRNKSSSPVVSSHFTVPPSGTDQAELLASVRNQWSQTLSAMPQAIWLRRSGTISNGVPFTSREATSCYPPSVLSFEPSTLATPPLVANEL
jgi:hypothetical protein